MDRKTLEKRLIDYSLDVIGLCQRCDFNEYTHHLLKQIVRSSSSSALNYGEAQSAESRADFLLQESNQLISIFQKTVNTLRKNNPGK